MGRVGKFMSVNDDTGGIRLSGLSGQLARYLDMGRTILRAEDRRALAQRTSAFAFLIRVASAAIAYLMQVALARWMGGFEYGIFVFVWVWVIIGGTVSGIGFNTSVLRFAPEYREADDMKALRGFLYTSKWLPVMLSTLVAMAGGMGIFVLGDWMENYYVIPAFLALFCLPLYTLTDIHDGTARAHDWAGIALIPPYLLRPLLILAIMAVAIFWFGYEASASLAVFAAIGATWFAALVQWFVLHRRLAPIVPTGPKRSDLKFWVRISFPFVLVEGFYILLAHTDILVLAVYLPPDQVAIYFAALKTISLVSFVGFAVTAGVAHQFADLNSKGNRAELESFVRDTVNWTFWPSLAAAIGILAVGYPLLMLFGPAFTAGYPLMFILAFGILAKAMVGPVESLLNMLGHQVICAKVLIATVVLNIAANFAIVPILGLPGAAIATSTAVIIESAILCYLAKRLVGINVLVWHGRQTGSAK